MSRGHRGVIWVVALTLAAPSAGRAQPAGSSSAAGVAPAPAEADRAREAFLRGVRLVRQEQWAEALVEFERSLSERPHAVTYYNAALCHRALGRSVHAVHALESAFQRRDELTEPTRQDAQRLLDELSARRAFVRVELFTPGSTVTVDGRPLERLSDLWAPSYRSGARSEAGSGARRLALEPGEHELRVTREGHEPAALRLTLEPGEQRSWRVELAPLPGLLVVGSRPPRAWLRLNDQPVGELPVELPRPAGPYRLEVTAPGRVPFLTQVTLRPGERTDVMADLREERPSLVRRWWFWAGVGVLVTGAAVTTYALTRPTEKADGGTLGWVVRP